jgi:hypothetical protein
MDLHEICLKIHDVCDSNGIFFTVIWIPRSGNAEADYLSRCFDSDDWSVNKDVFRYLNVKWGPFTIDRFSTHCNNNCKRFNSRWWVPGTEAVYCLTQNWFNENNRLVPPPSMVIQCIDKLEKGKM